MSNLVTTPEFNHFQPDHTQAEQARTLDQLAFIEEHGELGEALLDHCYDLENAKEAIDHNYYGEHYSEQDFVKSYMADRADEMLPVNSFEHSCLSSWLNWDHITWQVMMDFTAIEVNGMTHIFRDF